MAVNLQEWPSSGLLKRKYIQVVDVVIFNEFYFILHVHDRFRLGYSVHRTISS